MHVHRRLPGWCLLPAVALATAVPAISQVLEYAADSASATAAIGGVMPAAETPVIFNPVLPAASPLNEERILGVMPDYQTVRDTTRLVPPLTVRQKWLLAEKETLDPFNIATALLTAAESQAGNETPKYGEGWANYGKRAGAAQADFAAQNFFSAGVLASLLHQDPRYFRRGPQSGILPRVAYSISRLVVARQDSGRDAFNASGIGGMVLGIAASNIYYPSASVRGSVMAGRVWTSLMGGAVGNLMSEFWPDLQHKFFHHK
jgi:hypothetical protein